MTKLLVLSDIVTKERSDLILVIVNKLIKYTEIILFKEIYTVLELSYILLDKLI